MTDIKCYVCPVPDNDQTTGQSSRRPENALQGLLNQDTASAERISTPPGEQRIVLQYKGRYADLMASEIEELADSDGYAEIPLYGVGERTNADGYYLVDQSNVGPTDPRERRIQDVDLSLSRSGTRSSHYRAVRTNPREVTHPFGSGTTAALAVSSDAEARLWVNETTGNAQPASPATKLVEAEFGYIDIYQLGDSPYPEDETVLVYDLDYADIGPTDVRVWDTRGYRTRDDADGLPRWQKVFVSTHDFGADPIVISSGLLRVTLDTSLQPGLRAATLDPDGGELVGGDRAYGDAGYGEGIYTGHPPIYDAVALGDTSWSLQEVDIGHRQDQKLGPGRVDVHTRWLGPGGARYDLDLSVRRGQQSLLVARPPDETDPIPDGLQTLLSPIADTNVVHPQAAITLRARDTVTTN